MVQKELDREGDGPNRDNSLYCRTLAELFLAMAFAQRGEGKQAREALEQAIHILEDLLPEKSSGILGNGWNDWLQCRIVRREAESLVRR
jgi:hypothetical protein